MRLKSLPRKISPLSKCFDIKYKPNTQILQADIKDWVNVNQELPEMQDSLVWKQLTNNPFEVSISDKKSEVYLNHDEDTEILDLSLKSHLATSTQDEFKNTYLYRIMTDPDFLTNLKKSKVKSKYPCVYCNKEFDSELKLAEHNNIPLNKNNEVVCCACFKTFSKIRYLRYHLRSHFEKTKYTCDICTRKYSRLDNLTRHNNLHTNPNKFPCSTCERAFSRKDLLNKHEKYHENKHRYQCNTCLKYFKGFNSFQYHHYIYHRNSDKY